MKKTILLVLLFAFITVWIGFDAIDSALSTAEETSEPPELIEMPKIANLLSGQSITAKQKQDILFSLKQYKQENEARRDTVCASATSVEQEEECLGLNLGAQFIDRRLEVVWRIPVKG